MRLVPVRSLQINSEIAVDVINNDGKLMLKEGQKVTPKGIEILEKLGISYVYIKDEYCFSGGKKNKYPTKIDYFYKSILQLEELANKSMSGRAHFTELQDTMYIATKFVEDVLAEQESLKISYEPNKLSVNPFIEQTIYVAIMAVILGAKMKLSKEKLVKLCVAALLKDIALISPNAKTSDGVYMQHPILSYKYLKGNYSIDEEILEAILHHHELADGSGYPNKLKGEEINQLARIISVVDAFYEVKINHKMLGNTHGVLEENLKKLFKKFDMNVLGYFLKNVEIFTLDSMVILNNGDIGVIYKNNDRNPFKPCVKIVKSSYNLEGEIID